VRAAAAILALAALSGCGWTEGDTETAGRAETGAVCIADADCEGRCLFDEADGLPVLAGRCAPLSPSRECAEPGAREAAPCAG
jgi:hypothetical protein